MTVLVLSVEVLLLHIQGRAINFKILTIEKGMGEKIQEKDRWLLTKLWQSYKKLRHFYRIDGKDSTRFARGCGLLKSLMMGNLCQH